MTDSTSAESKKRPASQYYWGDWWKDKGLHSCGLPARGLWHEMNCLMHEGEPYGHLTLNSKPMTTAQLANQCRITPAVCKKLLAELEAAGVYSLSPDGVIFSRRMVRDEERRNRAAQIGRENGALGAEFGERGAEHGKKGGRPRKDTGGEEGGNRTPQNPPSSSSSSSSSSKTPPTPQGGLFPSGFAEFWSAWPKSQRKGGKAECEKLWDRERLDAFKTEILAHVRTMAGSHDWTKDHGAFIPAPVVYLRGKRWDGADAAAGGDSLGLVGGV